MKRATGSFIAFFALIGAATMPTQAALTVGLAAAIIPQGGGAIALFPDATL